jgi:hypothetical protein
MAESKGPLNQEDNQAPQPTKQDINGKIKVHAQWCRVRT